ncbi:MAG: VCBS repeat-containing protein [Acidobacteria bacterium]|nr:VCBS repeat-containing protein [Acidobacteriota bacterium]
MNKIRIVTIILCLLPAAAAFGQQLKPTEIIYSRLPTNPFQAPQGTNQPAVWAVGQDGSNDRFITYGTMPRISDDGRFLIFKRFTRNTASYNPFGGYADIFIRELATGQETLVKSLNFDEPSTTLSYTPESNQGVFEIVYENADFIYKINRDGTNLTRFPWLNAEYSFDDFPIIRRGGDQRIAVSNRSLLPNVGGFYTLGVDGANRQKIPNTTCRDYAPAWSNENQFLAAGTAYQVCSETLPTLDTYPYWVANLFKIKPDGTGRQQLTNYPASPDCANPAVTCLTLGYVWTEDNSKVLAAGRINGVKGLFAFNADGSGAFTQIPTTAGNAPEYVGGIVPARVERNVVSIGGGVAASAQFTLVSTIGEPIAGLTSVGGTYNLASGFWANPVVVRKSLFDFDGDGKTDIGIFRPSDGSWWYTRSSDNGPRVFSFGTSSDILTPGDFTGDGKADIAVWRPSTGFWFVQRSEDNSFFSFPFGASGDVPAPADYDGDGKTDAAVFRPSTTTWFILRSGDGGTTIQNFGLAGDKPVVADFTGDGKTDIAIYRPSNGQWWYLNSTNGQVAAFQFGSSADRPVPGDFTGDGKADAAFFRPSTGEWFILRSEDSSYFSTTFGTAGDVPAPGDYDGDGKIDTAIFRPSTNTWWINRTSQGLLSVGFGATGDQPVPAAYVR